MAFVATYNGIVCNSISNVSTALTPTLGFLIFKTFLVYPILWHKKCCCFSSLREKMCFCTRKFQTPGVGVSVDTPLWIWSDDMVPPSVVSVSISSSHSLTIRYSTFQP
uniref:Uncharacterized protein n=1 Tax=Cacopsylla melanoneura TaxID=428564 RepID=A0A8D8VQH8_9HEMI